MAYDTVLFGISLGAMRHYDPKASWGGKGLFGFGFHTTVDHQRKSRQKFNQDKDLEAGADAEAMGDAAY